MNQNVALGVGSTVTVAVWHVELKLAKVVKQRGKLIRSMGFIFRGMLCLAAEEILYLAERGQLVLHVEGSESSEPICLHAVYSLVVEPRLNLTRFPQTSNRVTVVDESMTLVPLICYWVYAHMRALGYVVFRANAHKGNCHGSPVVSEVFDECMSFVFKVHEPAHNNSKLFISAPAFYLFVTYVSNAPSLLNLKEAINYCRGVPSKMAVVSSDGAILVFDIAAGVAARH